MAEGGKVHQVVTPRFGRIEFTEEEILTALVGLFAFEDLKQFLLLSPAEIEPFQCLQSIQNPDVAFALLDPRVFLPEYRVEIPQKVVNELQIENLEKVRQLVIVTIPSGKPEKMTANLLAPIVINLESRKLKQVVLTAPQYHTRHSILEILEKGIKTDTGG
jgi:flagellar assembly factor FliW